MAIKDALTKEKENNKQLASDLWKAMQKPPAAASAPDIPRVVVKPEQYEQALVAVLNQWWKEESDREGLKRLVSQLGLPAEFYAMTGLETARQSVAWSGPYTFERSDRDGGWLFVKYPGGKKR